MIDKKLLGRYEYRDEKSDKYWKIEEKGAWYVAEWGPNGAARPLGTKEYTEGEAQKKIREKIAKGYEMVSPSESILYQIKDEKRKAAERVAVKRKEREEVRQQAIDFISELRKLK